jgi:hypothetical protein
MKGHNSESVLFDEKIQNLAFSDDFKKKCRLMGFDTLSKITELGPEDLVKKEAFDYSWLGELISFLKEKKLLHKLQPVPGNSPA